MMSGISMASLSNEEEMSDLFSLVGSKNRRNVSINVIKTCQPICGIRFATQPLAVILAIKSKSGKSLFYSLDEISLSTKGIDCFNVKHFSCSMSLFLVHNSRVALLRFRVSSV